MATQQQIDAIWRTSLHGDHVALDFANTVDWRLRDPEELLVDYEVLMHWGRRLGVISDDGEFEKLVSASRRHPNKAQAALERAVELRETVYRIYAALAAGDAPGQSDLDALNTAFADAVAHAALRPSEGGSKWSWAGTDAWSRVARPVAAAAAELLLWGELDRVKQCRAEDCGWVFFDKSKNGSRRWCSMQGCGSREKMRAQYRRKKTELPPS
jgi:predicted RNA-binding Zn ribbon-like protein